MRVPTLSRSFPIARQPHRCDSCGGPIKVGQQYHYWKGTSSDHMWDGIATLKECPECCSRYSRQEGK